MQRVQLSADVDFELLDLMLPGEDGIGPCRWLREHKDLSIIMIRALACNPGWVRTQDHLLELTRGRRADPFDWSIDVRFSRLRRQLGSAGVIKTVSSGRYPVAVDQVSGSE